MKEFFLPVLSHFENGNGWTASDGKLHYKLTPKDDIITAEGWEGPFAYEFSAVEETTTFPMTEEGLLEIAQWIDTWTLTMNARPTKSLTDMIAQREAIADE